MRWRVSFPSVQGVKWPGFDVSDKFGEAWITSSLKEPKAVKLASKHTARVLDHTEKQLMRVYPGPLRVDSSNYNPSFLWAVGCQLVALNLQTDGMPTQLNRVRRLGVR